MLLPRHPHRLLPVLLLAPALLATACEPAPPPPANDAFAAARVLPGTTSGLVTMTTLGATRQVGEPAAADGSVWFSWTAPVTGAAVFENRSILGGQQVDVFSGATLSGLTRTDTEAAAGEPQSGARVVAGTTYRIRVSGRGSSGSLRWRTSTVPANDAKASAAELAGASGSVRVDATAATGAADDPDIAGARPAATVWYRWTAPTDGWYALDTSGSAIDSVLGVFSDASPSVSLAEANGFCSPMDGVGSSRVVLPAQAGASYLVAIGRADDGEVPPAVALGGALQLNWRGVEAPVAPANDGVASATALTGTHGIVAGTTTAATAEPGEPAHAGSPASNSVWYAFTPSASGTYVFGAGDQGCDARVGVYRAAATMGGLTAVAPLPADPADEFADPRTVVKLTAGTSYLIAVDGTSQTGEFDLEWDVPQAAPRITRVTAGDRSVTVTWTPPPATPGTARQGYFVLAEPESPIGGYPEPQYLPVTSGSATIRGLRNGTGYRVVLAAVNGAGPGAVTMSARLVPFVAR